MGEPAGIGAEITLKAWRMRHGRNLPEFAVLADPHHLEEVCADLGLNVPVNVIDDLSEVEEIFDRALPVLPVPLAVPSVPGIPGPENAQAVQDSIEQAVDLCRTGQAGGIVTNPIHKAVLAAAGFAYPGHTEYLAALCGGNDIPVMMLAALNLRVVPLTIHIALKDVPKAVTQDLIISRARITYAALRRDFGIENPCLAVAGLNPHAGEDGKFGREEMEIIAPAVELLRAEGLNVTGPHAADTLFFEEARQNYDAALCMYHDQALIPVKTLDFHGGVNVTLGLPIIRTSPDHGTALNIAGQGVARPDSLTAALNMAGEMAKAREDL